MICVTIMIHKKRDYLEININGLKNHLEIKTLKKSKSYLLKIAKIIVLIKTFNYLKTQIFLKFLHQTLFKIFL